LAKVFADDAALNYTGTQRYLTFIKSKVYDAGGNNNGRLDPGETANLTAFLRNIGGSAFNNLSTTLQTSSPYITINDNSGNFGHIGIDTTKENTSDPYIVKASVSTPQGHIAQFRIIANETGFADTFDFTLVVGTYHYLVWDPDKTPTSGKKIDSLLKVLGYSGVYSTTLPTRGNLDIYRAIFVCVGIFANNYVIGASSAEATSLVDYLNNSGGRMYLEGGDVWYYDPLIGGYNFCPLFGINATADGTIDMGPVAGQTGTFTNGMNFNYSGENSYMDHISPGGTGAFLIFYDTDNNYDCGVARDVGTYKTVGTSFELGCLVDAGGVSTRKALVDSIMHFFGITVIGVEETSNEVKTPILSVFPNPFRQTTNIKFQIPSTKSQVSIEIYDALGRLVRQWDYQTMRLSDQILWDGANDRGIHLPAGIYFVRLEVEEDDAIQKIILLK